jgi:nucleoside-diphosphate-sugar epimerase
VHAAALVGARTTRDAYGDQNVQGTRNVLSAGARSGIRRAVHVSSVAVYGTIDGAIVEDRWQEVPIHDRAFYAWSKRASEQAGELSVTTVRPALIYGERDRHVAARLDRLLRAPFLPLPDGGRHIPPLVYAGNVARGIVAALDRPASAGRAYNVAQDHALSLREFVRQWCAASARRAPLMPSIPGKALQAGARFVDHLSRRLPGLDLPGLRRPAGLISADNPYDSSRARQELGWTNLLPAEEAIRRTVAWLRTRDDPRASER